MHIAILVTNTDDSSFAEHHPKDGAKFSTMLHNVRPNWKLSVFEVKDGEFPVSLEAFDGLVITGSPASVHDGFDWIAKLKSLIVEAYTADQPMFGACFGHQAIAEALGGKVSDNPGGWVFGTVETVPVKNLEWLPEPSTKLHLHAAHKEQVVVLPENAEIITTQQECAIAGFHIGSKVYTTQYHPEITPEFFNALTEELSGYLPDEVIARARLADDISSDNLDYAETVARFFEQN